MPTKRRTVMKVIPRSLRLRIAEPLRRLQRLRLLYTTEHPVETNGHRPAEGNPDDAGAALDVAERDLAGATFHTAVLRVVAVVAHHEHPSLLHHEGARGCGGTLQPGVLAQQDGVNVTVEVLDVLAGDHLDVPVDVIGGGLFGKIPPPPPLLRHPV